MYLVGFFSNSTILQRYRITRLNNIIDTICVPNLFEDIIRTWVYVIKADDAISDLR